MNQTYYIAFSIHGTNAFITAACTDPKVIQHFTPLSKFGFKVVNSRRPDYDPKKGIKLHWDKLLTKAGEPLRSVPMILKHFNELAKAGWVVDKKAFIDKHYRVLQHSDNLSLKKKEK